MRFYGTDILNSLRRTIGTTIGSESVASMPEGSPLDWIGSAKFPAVFLMPSNSFPMMGELASQGPKMVEQVYTGSIYYVMARGTSGNPWETVRERGEEIANKVDVAKRTGFGGFEINDDDRWLGLVVTHCGMDMEVQRMLRENEQPYAAYEVGFQLILYVAWNT